MLSGSVCPGKFSRPRCDRFCIFAVASVFYFLVVTTIGCTHRSTPIVSDNDSVTDNDRLPPKEFQLTRELVREHGRGVALMGRFEFDKAHEVFTKLTEEYPAWTDARVDLAIATLNRQQPEDEKQAAEILESVLAKHPDDLRAKYCRAVLHLHGGEAEQALELFRARSPKRTPRIPTPRSTWGSVCFNCLG